jgi:hypothetical protein
VADHGLQQDIEEEGFNECQTLGFDDDWSDFLWRGSGRQYSPVH